MVICKAPHPASQVADAALCAADGEVTLHAVQDFKKRVDLESMSAAYSRIPHVHRHHRGCDLCMRPRLGLHAYCTLSQSHAQSAVSHAPL